MAADGDCWIRFDMTARNNQGNTYSGAAISLELSHQHDWVTIRNVQTTGSTTVTDSSGHASLWASSFGGDPSLGFRAAGWRVTIADADVIRREPDRPLAAIAPDPARAKEPRTVTPVAAAEFSAPDPDTAPTASDHGWRGVWFYVRWDMWGDVKPFAFDA